MRHLLSVALLAAAGFGPGCAYQPYLRPEREARGLVIVLPGVEGRGPLNEAICDGLDNGGVDWGLDLVDWTAPLGPLWNLRAETQNRQKARQIAVRVAEYKFAHPDNPVILVGQSGGGAIALWVAGALPQGLQLDGIILLSPAISPGYMIDFALGKTRRGVINFYSEKDWFFLGVGTTIYGTMDGQHTSSAGRGGFKLPIPSVRPPVYDKLYQIAWHEQMAAAGHTGGHLSSSAGGFIRHYVSPFVLAGHWSDDVVAAVLTGRKIGTDTEVPLPEWKPMSPDGPGGPGAGPPAPSPNRLP